MTTFNFRGLPDCFVRMIRFFVLRCLDKSYISLSFNLISPSVLAKAFTTIPFTLLNLFVNKSLKMEASQQFSPDSSGSSFHFSRTSFIAKSFKSISKKVFLVIGLNLRSKTFNLEIEPKDNLFLTLDTAQRWAAPPGALYTTMMHHQCHRDGYWPSKNSIINYSTVSFFVLCTCPFCFVNWWKRTCKMKYRL